VSTRHGDTSLSVFINHVKGSTVGEGILNAAWFMTDRLVFITHQRKQVLSIDASGCSAADVEAIFRAVPDLVNTRPLASVLILCDYTGTSFDRAAIRAMKEAAVFNKAYVRKSASVGFKSLPPDFYKDVKSFSSREFSGFKTREEALAWLVED
jgi:hypothetical protein